MQALSAAEINNEPITATRKEMRLKVNLSFHLFLSSRAGGGCLSPDCTPVGPTQMRRRALRLTWLPGFLMAAQVTAETHQHLLL